jgi:integrase
VANPPHLQPERSVWLRSRADRSEEPAHVDSKRRRKPANIVDRDVSLGPLDGELLRLSKGDLRAVQEHLRHADIQTTTLYTRLTK